MTANLTVTHNTELSPREKMTMGVFALLNAGEQTQVRTLVADRMHFLSGRDYINQVIRGARYNAQVFVQLEAAIREMLDETQTRHGAIAAKLEELTELLSNKPSFENE